MWTFSNITALSIVIVIPLCAFVVRAGDGATRLGLRFKVGVFGVWLALLLHRWLVSLPITRAQADARGDWTYDGIGTNAGLLIGGWLPGLFVSCVACLVVRYVCARSASRRT